MSRSKVRRIATQADKTAQPTHSSVDIHRGDMLFTIANTYPSLMLTVVEMIQNGIDAGANRVFVGIDLKNNRVTAADNGNGVDDKKFDEALASVGRSIKSKDKLGRFGQGLIAPLNKCAHFTFTSKVEGRRPVRWTFRGSDMRRQHRTMDIPRQQLNEMPAIVKLFRDQLSGEFDQSWRTIVHMEGVTKDKVTSLIDLDELESQVRNKLGMAMREYGASVHVVLIDGNGIVVHRDIDPVMFTGHKFEIVDYVDTEGTAGRIQIELYRANRVSGRRNGQVLVMEYNGNYPLPIQEVVRQFRGGKVDSVFEEVLAILTSGFFEGIIRCENITLAPERTKFVYNESLHDLFYVLGGSWYEQFGKEQYDDEQERTREQRYQRLGIQSQDRLKENLPRNFYEKLRELIKYGRLGDGHIDPAKGHPDGFEEETSLRSGQGGAGKERTPRESTKPRERQKDPIDRPGDIPTGALGPNGRERQLVRGDSEGLWFEYSSLFANSHLWEFDLELGIITFNTKHPIWVLLDETNGRHTLKNEKQILDLQEWLTLQILTLLINFPDADSFEQRRSLIDDQIKPYTQMFIVNKRR